MRFLGLLSLSLVATISVGCGEGTVDIECASDSECDDGFICVSSRCHPELGTCDDLDGDSYRVGTRCPASEEIDCDDSDPDVNPGATEICGDGVNQNCIAGADEGCPCTDVSVGSTRDCGMGRCSGVQTCGDTGWGECVPLISPERENCGPDGMGDGFDDDCNGEVDNGCLECPSRPDGMGGENACFDDAGDPTYCSSNGTCR
jgi:hypothetical protein